jgi:diketogulonate reductase-like aldo/keto reductase
MASRLARPGPIWRRARPPVRPRRCVQRSRPFRLRLSATQIGVSNYRVVHLEETLKSAKSKPVVNQVRSVAVCPYASHSSPEQVELHPYVWSEQKRVVDYCHQNNIRIAAYSPQAPLTKLTGGPVDAVVQRIASELKITPGQVLLKWAQKAGDFVVTTSSKPERMVEMLEAASIAELSQANFDAIAEAGAQWPTKRVYMTHIRDEVEPVKK